MTESIIQESINQGLSLPDLLAEVRQALSDNPRTIVVLDDDPTGTQTVHNVPVITDWGTESLQKEISESPLFFILTNSRSLQQNEARELALLLGNRLQEIAAKLGKKLIVISRSDSTLRGHYPIEVKALKEGMGWTNSKELLIPAFFEGGRYTFGDVHYVKEGDTFVPAAETPFAKDKTFGYQASNLREWIAEKTNGELRTDEISSISIASIRENGVNDITEFLESGGSHVVVNATTVVDLQKVALACLKSQKQIIYRTAASFVNAVSGVTPKRFRLNPTSNSNSSKNGGLVIVGSYVPKTTAQLNYLRDRNKELHFLEFSVDTVDRDEQLKLLIQQLGDNINEAIAAGQTVVLYTSRELKSGSTKEENLDIVNRVSAGLVAVVSNVTVQPEYVVAKGGITSSDIAVKALGVKRAIIAGQLLDGVPVWLPDTGSKFPRIPYIVFPGNVGDDTALHQLIQMLQ